MEHDQGELTSVVMEDILGEPCVHVPNVLPTHPNLMLNSDFIPFDDSLGSDLEVSFPSGTRNKIFDPGIFFEVQSKSFLSHLSVILSVQPISFDFSESPMMIFRGIWGTCCLSVCMLSSFSIVIVPFDQLKLWEGIVRSGSGLFRETIRITRFHGIAPDYEASRAHGFVLRSLELKSLV
ncbi:hypothetical protein Tco_1342628 [Tanacetum coccineum]